MIIKSKFSIIFAIVLFVAGIAAGFFISKTTSKLKCDVNSYQFINLELVCGSKLVINKRSYVEFRNNLNDVLKKKINDKEISNVSVYFRDLQYGPTMGINEYERYAPASLLKLPLFITYLSLGEQVQDLDKARLHYQPSVNNENFSPSFPPKKSLEENKEYSINELLEYMIEYSDNKSYYTLLNYLNQILPDKDLLKETYIDLGIIDPQSSLDDTITVRSYAGIFAQLYYSSFLKNKETSEKALKMLSKSDFSSGIEAGVPKGVRVAHKFGERTGFDGDLKQLHDCGIIYFPDNPYSLCVMTQGYDNQKLAETIQLISKMVYDEINSRKY